jgi:hypothetical protein
MSKWDWRRNSAKDEKTRRDVGIGVIRRVVDREYEEVVEEGMGGIA